MQPDPTPAAAPAMRHERHFGSRVVRCFADRPATVGALFDAALAEHILVAPGTLFSNTARCDGFLRVNCGIPWSPVLADGLRRLGELAGQTAARRPPPVQSPASSASAA